MDDEMTARPWETVLREVSAVVDAETTCALTGESEVGEVSRRWKKPPGVGRGATQSESVHVARESERGRPLHSVIRSQAAFTDKAGVRA